MTEVSRSIEVRAPPQEVWDALTNDKKLSDWLECEGEITPRIGGSFRFDWGEDWVASGTIEAFEPARRLVATWEWEGDDEETTVEYALAKTATGTRLTISHRGFEDEETAQEHADTWAQYLENLPRVLGAKK